MVVAECFPVYSGHLIWLCFRLEKLIDTFFRAIKPLKKLWVICLKLDEILVVKVDRPFVLILSILFLFWVSGRQVVLISVLLDLSKGHVMLESCHFRWSEALSASLQLYACRNSKRLLRLPKGALSLNIELIISVRRWASTMNAAFTLLWIFTWKPLFKFFLSFVEGRRRASGVTGLIEVIGCVRREVNCSNHVKDFLCNLFALRLLDGVCL